VTVSPISVGVTPVSALIPLGAKNRFVGNVDYDLSSGGVNWTLWNRTTFDVQAQRQISFSYYDAQPYYLLTNARLSITQKIFGPVDLIAGAERQFLSYRFRRGQVAGTDFAPDEAVRNVVTGGVGVTLRRGFRVVVSGERTVRTSPFDPEGNFSRTRLLSTVTIGS